MERGNYLKILKGRFSKEGFEKDVGVNINGFNVEYLFYKINKSSKTEYAKGKGLGGIANTFADMGRFRGYSDKMDEDVTSYEFFPVFSFQSVGKKELREVTEACWHFFENYVKGRSNKAFDSFSETRPIIIVDVAEPEGIKAVNTYRLKWGMKQNCFPVMVSLRDNKIYYKTKWGFFGFLMRKRYMRIAEKMCGFGETQ